MHTTTLTNVQLEIIKLYSTGMKRQELFELKEVLAAFFARKAIKEADTIWDEQNLTNADMDAWLSEGQQ